MDMNKESIEKIKEIWQALKGVEDPEIPVISIVDLGIVTDVTIDERGRVMVEMTPTFTGCPAIEVMKKGIEKKLLDLGVEDYRVELNYKTTWTSNRISEEGRDKLEKFGLGRPASHEGEPGMDDIANARCPHCGSENTTLKSVFGSTLCRSIHICHDCRQSFERFKPV
jgi:ring-1,2-phenylacetyl-CoA epoxidase subunit PaaD